MNAPPHIAADVGPVAHDQHLRPRVSDSNERLVFIERSRVPLCVVKDARRGELHEMAVLTEEGIAGGEAARVKRHQ